MRVGRQFAEWSTNNWRIHKNKRQHVTRPKPDELWSRQRRLGGEFKIGGFLDLNAVVGGAENMMQHR